MVYDIKETFKRKTEGIHRQDELITKKLTNIVHVDGAKPDLKKGFEFSKPNSKAAGKFVGGLLKQKLTKAPSAVHGTSDTGDYFKRLMGM